MEEAGKELKLRCLRDNGHKSCVSISYTPILFDDFEYINTICPKTLGPFYIVTL